jgi:hypothetical protein
MNRQIIRRSVVALVAAVASGVALADPPATATALAAAVDMSDAKAAGLTIIGLLVAAGVVLWGARLVLSKFAPRV